MFLSFSRENKWPKNRKWMTLSVISNSLCLLHVKNAVNKLIINTHWSPLQTKANKQRPHLCCRSWMTDTFAAQEPGDFWRVLPDDSGFSPALSSRVGILNFELPVQTAVLVRWLSVCCVASRLYHCGTETWYDPQGNLPDWQTSVLYSH